MWNIALIALMHHTNKCETWREYNKLQWIVKPCLVSSSLLPSSFLLLYHSLINEYNCVQHVYRFGWFAIWQMDLYTWSNVYDMNLFSHYIYCIGMESITMHTMIGNVMTTRRPTKWRVDFVCSSYLFRTKILNPVETCSDVL